MYENGKIYMGLADGARVELALNMCNRHGLIAGASGVIKIICIVIAFVIAFAVWAAIFLKNPKLRKPPQKGTEKTGGSAEESAGDKI